MAKTVLARAINTSLDPTIDDSGIQFVFASDTAADFSNIAAVTTAVSNFFNVAGTGGVNAMAAYISGVMSRATNASRVEVYDITTKLDGSTHGSPVAIVDFTLAALSGTSVVPNGAAATIGFRADYGTDVEFAPGARPRARDRNRVYLGPLSNFGLEVDPVTNRCRFKSTMVTDCLASMFDLSNTHTSGGESWNLRIWSRKNAAVKLPTIAFMDNQPDYQRRRVDPAPGTKTSRALASV